MENNQMSVIRTIDPSNQGISTEMILSAVALEFQPFRVQTLGFEESMKSIKVDTKDECGIAKSRILTIKDSIKALDETHKNLKAPFKGVTDMIDEERRIIKESLEKIVKNITTKVTMWEVLDKQRQAAELKKKQDAQNAISALVTADLNKITQLVNNAKAVLYGGTVTNSSGVFQRPGIFAVRELEMFRDSLAVNLPSSTDFRSECTQAFLDAMTNIQEMIQARMESLLTSTGTTLSNKEISVIVDSNAILGDTIKKQVKETLKIEREISVNNTGLRRDITWEVYDMSKLPFQYLMVNQSALNDYKVAHRTEILEHLKDKLSGSIDVIPGVKFNVEVTSNVR